MAIKIKDIRYKHQLRAIEITKMDGEKEKEAAYEEFSISLVESWDFKDENGEVFPISPSSDLFHNLKIADIKEMREAITLVLFPKEEVKKTNSEPLPSGSMPSKAEKRVKEKSLNGSTISPLAVGQG